MGSGRQRSGRRVGAGAIAALAAITVSVGFSVLGGTAAAQDPGTTTSTVPEAWPGSADLATAWEITATGATSIDVVGEQAVATFEDGRIAAYGTDGAEAWSTTVDLDDVDLAEVHGIEQLGDVVVVVAGAAAGTDIRLVALDPLDGTVVWTRPYEGSMSTFDLAVTDGDALVISSRFRDLVAYGPSGETLWERSFDVRFAFAGQIDGVAFGVLDTRPIALSMTDGTTVWEGEDIGADTMRLDDGNLMVTATQLDEVPIDNSLNDTALASLDPATGEPEWVVEIDQTYDLQGWTVFGDLVVVVRGHDATAYDRETGADAWKFNRGQLSSGANFSGPPRVAGDRVLIGSGATGDELDGSVLEVTAGGQVAATLPFSGRPTAMTSFGDDVAMTVETDDGFQLLAFTPTSSIVPDEPEPEPEEESVLLGIPSPADALTPKNAGLAGALLMLLLVLVVVPSTLFNKALADRLPSLTTRRPRPLPTGDDDGRPLQHRWKGLVLYLVVSAAVYSLLEPGWGANMSTAVTMVAFGLALTVTTVVEFTSRRLVLRKRYGRADGHPELWFPSLGIAALCVVGSRAIAFVPGYVYGVVAEFNGRELTEEDEGRFELYAATTMLVLAIAAWFAAAGLGGLGDRGLAQLPAATAAGIFMAGVETLTVGLLPVALLPGATLRRVHAHWWKVLWGTSAFLFCLAMLRPGLVSAQSGSTRWLLTGAAAYGGGAVLFWWIVQRRSGPMVPFPEPAAEPDVESSAGDVGTAEVGP